jgi:cytochrome P450
MKLLGDRFPKEESFLLDMWPATPPLLVFLNPEAATQAAQKFNLPKNKMIEDMVLPIAGGPNLLSMNGEEWKMWRSLFNARFSSTSVMAQVPSIIESVEIFCEELRKYADNKRVVCLDETTMRLTFDIIMKVSL